ncbi:MAG: NAD-dependent epimerase/dehydratase family protein [Candidatus Lokiarchaeota archaeon]|nr:NAD-dependent epimerase/dehydratase family protein [Candidatus Lokiarchaeota archaeon]
MKKDSKIYIAGHRGMVGSAIRRKLDALGYDNLLMATRDSLDLTRQESVEKWFEDSKPEFVFLAAAKVGGIAANMASPAEFFYDNMMIECNVIHMAFKTGTKRLLFLGSSCIYPRKCPQPMKEEYILTGPPEPTNEAYAVAKIAGLKMCQYYRTQYNFDAFTIVPPNLYGPRDNFSPQDSHVVAALIRKFHEAKVEDKDEVVIWGTGTARRELMYVEDLADAAVFLMNNYDQHDFINVGTDSDVSILELAQTIMDVIGFEGKIELDKSKPDGMPRKLMDSSRFEAMDWDDITPLEEGIEKTYEWYCRNVASS